MSLATFNPNLPTVIVPQGLTAAILMACMEAQWGIDFGTAHTFHISLWEGPSDADDYADLTITAGTPVLTTGFNTNPGHATAIYVLDIYWA